MSMDSPVRSLLLSVTLAVAGGAALVGLLATSGSPSLVMSGTARAEAATVPGRDVPAVTPQPSSAAPARSRAVPALPAVATPEVLRTQLAAGLDCALTPKGVPLCLHGEDRAPVGHSYAAGDGASGSTGTSGAIGCYGDGTSGPRIRAIYARPQSTPDRYAASLSSLRGWAAGVSRTVDASAAQTGGRRHVRFATTPGPSCTLTVLNVVLPDAAFGSFRATIDALEARGFDAPSSKYLVWADAAGYCGMGTVYADDRPGPDNLNNSSLPSYARIDRTCWGKVETHEVVHMLGGVQPSARNATAGFHCNDGRDVMCYDDGTAGGTQHAVCGKDRAHLLDCRSDDYFSTAAPRGSYLQTHWNTARSSFLSATLNEAPPAPPASPSPTASSSASPATSPEPEVLDPVVAVTPLPTPLPSWVPAPLSSLVPPAVPSLAALLPVVR